MVSNQRGFIRRWSALLLGGLIMMGSGIAGTVHADPMQGLGVVNPGGSIRIESEAVETWNGCIEHFNEMCGKICDPYETVNSMGSNCWDNSNKDFCKTPSSGLMGVGLCGTFSFVDFMPVPRATSFSVRHAKVTKDFTFDIFINGEPWQTQVTFPPSSMKIETDSGDVRVMEWKDTLFQDVPLDRDMNFIRIQRTGTGIPIIDYITVFPEGASSARNTPTMSQLNVDALRFRGDRVVFSLEKAQHITLELIDASGRVVRRVAHGTHEAGTHAASLDNRLRRGVFFVRLRAGSAATTKRRVALD